MQFYGNVCPECEIQGVSAEVSKPASGGSVIFATIICLIVVAVIAFPGLKSAQPESSRSVSLQPSDDAEFFISKYGPPDKQDSTDNDVPRPEIPTRFLVYEPEHVRVVYIPDAKIGDAPPYRWKLVGFQDDRDNSVLTVEEARARLKDRQRQ